MGPWRRELVRCMRGPMRRRRPVWTGPGPALRIPPAVLTLAVALVVAGTVIALLEAKLRPVVAELAAAQAQNTMTAVVENTVSADLAARQVSYGDFVAIQRDGGGAITALTTDMAKMNLLRAELTASILDALEEVDVSIIQVPLGSLFDLEPLWAKGPTLKVQAMTVGTVRAEFDSQLTSAGVNQTLHRIWMEVDVPITLLLPGGAVETSLHTRLCVAETVIVGQVPDTYLQVGDGAVKS
ncbi:sporulation protein YunB [Colidextribacter sp. OB.20]|uniref:sporulation protein YunB n=1 Tax=Colidextribacter sp. OB.20 TaxID=2304568 RepID=UPI00136E8E6C|nr:sporulation protein YunB [Colidextribacter sp. OB.20]NBI09352.1 sporulation protein YunB [Colidextribacter sp. OB.20]